MKPSRAMITGELSWAFMALCFAWAGSGIWPMETSHIHALLYTWDYDYLWTAIIGIPAVGLMWLGVKEHHASKVPDNGWDLACMNESAHKRGRLDIIMAFSWAYIAFTLLQIKGEETAMSMVSLGGVYFCLWFWVENRRVQREYRKLHPSAAG